MLGRVKDYLRGFEAEVGGGRLIASRSVVVVNGKGESYCMDFLLLEERYSMQSPRVPYFE